ncbi:MAG: arsenic metallochaperone ArsD family protein [Desulfuromonadales bacterium]|nr:arsenic metallochaperone ArsD family protein [Desulfuromonadales bacterium]
MKIEIFESAKYDPKVSDSPSAALKWAEGQYFLLMAKKAGVEVQRYEFEQNPMAFVEHAGVAVLLRNKGLKALPTIFIDGKLTEQEGSIEFVDLEKALALRGVKL